MDLRPEVQFENTTDIDRRSVESTAAVLAHDSDALIRHHMMNLDLTENLAMSILDDLLDEEVEHSETNTIEAEDEQKELRILKYMAQANARQTDNGMEYDESPLRYIQRG